MNHIIRTLKSRLLRIISRSLYGNADSCGTRNQSIRDAWLERTLAAIPSGSRILDAGAGELKYRHLCSNLDYVSQDFAQYDGKGDGKGFQTGEWDQSKLDIVSDITDIPDADNSFDAIMCIEVIEHIPYPVEALKEFARLLRPDGFLVLTAPFCSLTHFAPYFYYSGYSRYFYEYWLAKFNFEILEMEWNGNYFEFLAQEIRRLPDVSKTYANTDLGTKGHMAIEQMLGVLNRLSAADSGSRELLSFGLHILARKKS